LSETINPNTKLARYTIVSKIGAGGMGAVYLAQDPKLDLKVATQVSREGQPVRPLKEISANAACIWSG
jgi:serine/threonine protein kinase